EVENGVYVKGQVAFPGEYTILYSGERLLDFIKRAGGFKPTAYPEGIYVMRQNPELNILRPVQISDTTFLRAYQGEPIINRTQFNEQFGSRISVIWKDIQDNPSSIYNIRLMPNDTIVVPQNSHTVTVAGDVGLPSTVPYREGASLSYYIEQAGGYTSTSAEGKAIVILPNGMKWRPSGFFLIPNSDILAGSTIYVPSHVETTTDVWPVIRDIITVVSSTAVLVLTISRL
ncbi:MAG TPA: SLBB domain-containing protein, partial [Candidatus Kryptobacter bacterium]|nr:SLBB domain-containing protein [Candidatus Kryptobacter bacterium]